MLHHDALSRTEEPRYCCCYYYYHRGRDCWLDVVVDVAARSFEAVWRMAYGVWCIVVSEVTEVTEVMEVMEVM